MVPIGWVAFRLLQWRPSNLLGPIGEPTIAQDLTSLVGQNASAFSLRDDHGLVHTVVPGQGRPLVLVFHMGLH